MFIRKMFLFSCVCFLKNNFIGNYFLNFLCLFIIKKLASKKYFPINKKHFPVKKKFDLIFKKVFSFYFGQKTLSRSCEKFRNVILFADYIKFGPQTFDCYIYIYIYIYYFEYFFFNFII